MTDHDHTDEDFQGCEKVVEESGVEVCRKCGGKRFVKSWLSERWEAEGFNAVWIECPACNPTEEESEEEWHKRNGTEIEQ